MAKVLIIVVSSLVYVKLFALAWSMFEVCHRGGKLATALRDGGGDDVRANLPALLNPIDAYLGRGARVSGTVRCVVVASLERPPGPGPRLDRGLGSLT
jgi:hypothetical protein